MNMDVDGLSRNPISNHADDTSARWRGEGEADLLPGWHGLIFFNLLAMHGDTTEEAIVATIDEDGGEESGGAMDIYKDANVMYFKEWRSGVYVVR